MGIYAKSRKRLKYVDSVAIVEDGHGGYESVTLLKQEKRLIPIGTSNFQTLEAAKKDSAEIFQIREADWLDLPDGLIAEPDTGAVEEYYRKFDEFQKRPWDSDTVVPFPARCTPATTRKYKRLLLGTWRYGKYELRFTTDTWSLLFDGEMLMRPLSIFDEFTGRYSCTGGGIGFMSRNCGASLSIAKLDENELILTDGHYFSGRFIRG